MSKPELKRTRNLSLTIGQKMMGVIFLMVGLLVLVAGTGIVQMQKVATEVEEIAEQDMPLTEAITAITIHQLEQAINFERSLRYGAEMEHDEAARGHFEKAFERFEELTKQVDEELVEAEAIAKGAIEHANTKEAREEFEKILHALEKIEAEHADYEKHVEHTAKLIEEGELTEALEAAEKIEVEEEELDQELEALLLEIEKFTNESLKKAEEHEAFGLMLLSIISVIGTIVGSLLGFFLVRIVIVKPIRSMTSVMQKLAEGETAVDIPNTDRTDEIGQMAGTVQVFKDNAIEKEELAEREREELAAREARNKKIEDLIAKFDGTSSEVLKSVSSAAIQLQSNAQSMSATAEQTNKQSAAVVSASEEAAANVQTVASATEEMNSSIAEINTQINKSSEIAGAAAIEAQATTKTMKELADASQKIGDVVSLISDIAEQTNLLALNATIEAARAGEAGKGFAVVASEVKSLANQTAKATGDIEEQIGSIQSISEQAVKAIESITETIGKMNDVATAVSAAMTEQGAATQEIARNIADVSTGTNEVSSNIAGVDQGAQETGRAAVEVLSAAEELGKQAEVMKGSVESFLEGIRAA